jgi:acetyl-CoA synthetase
MATDTTRTASESPGEVFRSARDYLVATRDDYGAAREGFSWPRPEYFNFALDWFDGVLARERADEPALRIIEDDGRDASYTFAELSARSDQLAGWLRSLGVTRAMRVLVLLGNQVELWEVTLAVMKLGAVIIPASTLLTADDLRDRVDRAHAGAVVAR